MNVEEILARLQPWRARHERSAWRPQVSEGEAAAASQFGGVPWLTAEEDWPCCGSCGRPLTFFVQLDLASLPAALEGRFGGGLLQLFYCTACDEGWEPFATSQQARVLHAPASRPATARVPPGVEQFPPRAIVGWEAFADLPDPSEHDELGFQYTYDFAARTVRLNCPEVGLQVERSLDESGDLAEAIATADMGDKLAGWPAWVQGVEYPSCPKCQVRMQLVFQLDSEKNVPYMFGDVGIGHITQCPQHLEVVAFGWECH